MVNHPRRGNGWKSICVLWAMFRTELDTRKFYGWPIVYQCIVRLTLYEEAPDFSVLMISIIRVFAAMVNV